MSNKKINYIELPAKNFEATKVFFSKVFGWSFKDFGSDYTAFSSKKINGGFFKSDLVSLTKNGATLLIFYSNNLEQIEQKIKEANGVIVKQIFTFPGGRRFHFTEPSGNEFAIWSDK